MDIKILFYIWPNRKADLLIKFIRLMIWFSHKLKSGSWLCRMGNAWAQDLQGRGRQRQMKRRLFVYREDELLLSYVVHHYPNRIAQQSIQSCTITGPTSSNETVLLLDCFVWLLSDDSNWTGSNKLCRMAWSVLSSSSHLPTQQESCFNKPMRSFLSRMH